MGLSLFSIRGRKKQALTFKEYLEARKIFVQKGILKESTEKLKGGYFYKLIVPFMSDFPARIGLTHQFYGNSIDIRVFQVEAEQALVIYIRGYASELK